MRWLITGGCGFIGRNLIGDLSREPGTAIRVLDNLSQGRTSALPVPHIVLGDAVRDFALPDQDVVQVIPGDIRDDDTTYRAAADMQIVVHLAANTGVAQALADSVADCCVNVLGTLNCLEAARRARVRRFIFASSGAPLAGCEPPLHENLAPRPASPYGASKLAGEGYCSAFYHSHGLQTVALRFGNVYGPGSDHKGSVVAKLIREAIAGKTWTTYGDGNQTRDFIFITDLIAAIRKAASAPDVGGEVFQIATHAETSVNELIDRLGRVLADREIPVPKLLRAASMRGDARRNYSEINKARTMLGWEPRVSLDEGLARTVDWFLAAGAISRST